MIWNTAKSTDVNRCHRPYPRRARDVPAGRSASGRRDDGRARDGSGPLDGAERRDGPPVERPGRPERVREVRLQVLEVLEPDRDPQEARA